MARFDQYVGLNEWARKFVGKREKVLVQGIMKFADGRVRRFRHWTKLPAMRVRVIGVIRGAFTPEVAQLKEYTTPGGRVLREYIQAAPWCSGPNYYIALLDAATGQPVPESLWGESDMV